MKNKKRAAGKGSHRGRTAQEKLQIVLKATALSDDELGAFPHATWLDRQCSVQRADLFTDHHGSAYSRTFPSAP